LKKERNKKERKRAEKIRPFNPNQQEMIYSVADG
jgi:hypothetical protein